MTGGPLVVLGTRPEAIKLAPLFAAFEKLGGPAPTLCVTAQHRQMLDQVLDLFGLKPQHDLDLMRSGQDLFDITATALTGLKQVLEEEKPNVVVVQGDTTTVFAASLAAFYHKIPVAHVEAGLRTGHKYAPFPEEMNRLLTSDLADFHFAPTERAARNLLDEGRDPERVWVTGNTVIDALQAVAAKVSPLASPPGVDRGLARDLTAWSSGSEKLVVVTGHRRESFGGGFDNIGLALRELAERNPDVRIVYPVHRNPNVREPILRILTGVPRVHLLDPMPYSAWVWLMARCHLILTDSGGIQEEAPALGKPVLVLRDHTERPEAVEAGTAKLVGTSRERIVRETEHLLRDENAYNRMANVANPFGDGKASERIAKILIQEAR